MKENNSKLAVGKHEYNGKTYRDLRLVVTLKDGSECDLLVNIVCKDKKRLAKLLYKLEKGLE